MKCILSLGLAALAASATHASADTTVTVLEFGPGGAVHGAASSSSESSAAAVSSLWNALHRPSKRGTSPSIYSGLPVAPDLFTRADAGIVIGINVSGESLKAMPQASSLLEPGAANVVGQIRVPAGGVRKHLIASATTEDKKTISANDVERRLHLTMEAAVRGDTEGGMEVLSLDAEDVETAVVVDTSIGNILKTLKSKASAAGKTVVVHVVIEEEGRRRLAEEDRDGQNQNENSGIYEKTMYEIQTFNLYLWTAVGLVVLVSSVIGALINMPQMPDTLLFAETAKMAGSD